MERGGSSSSAEILSKLEGRGGLETGHGLVGWVGGGEHAAMKLGRGGLGDRGRHDFPVPLLGLVCRLVCSHHQAATVVLLY